MLNYFKKIIEKNSEKLGLLSFNPNKLLFSKFYQGDGRSGKVLFAFSYDRKLKGIIKVMRNEELNYKLELESNSQKEVSYTAKGFFVPTVYFCDKVFGFFIYCEELIDGEAIGEEEARKNIGLILNYQREIIKEREIKGHDLVCVFNLVSLNNESGGLLEKFNNSLEKNRNDFYFARQHGDLTYLNIIKDEEERLHLIDWGNFGERVVWGTDFCHYFSRCYKVNTLDDFCFYLNKERDNLGFNNKEINYFSQIFIVDRLLDILQKTDLKKYYLVIGKLASL